MFESITIKSTYSTPLDLGRVCEALLFYQHVHIIIGADALQSVFMNMNVMRNLLEYTDRGLITLHLLSTTVAIRGMNSHYHLGVVGKDDLADLLISGAAVTVTWKMDVTPQHMDMIELVVSKLNRYHLKDIVKDSNNDIFNLDYLSYSLNEVIQQKLPELEHPEKYYNLTFAPSPDHRKDYFLYNVDYDRTVFGGFSEKELHQTKLEAIAAIIEVQKNVTISTDLVGDLDSDTSYIRLLNKKFERVLIKDPFARKAQLSCFQEVAFKGFKNVAGAINSNSENIDKFTELMDKTASFKKWLAGIPNDKNVVAEYIAAITKEHWIDKLPNKLVRWYMFLGIGVMIDALGPGGGFGTAIGISTSAFDSLLLDKLLKGWKPNIFVEEEFQKFLRQ